MNNQNQKKMIQIEDKIIYHIDGIKYQHSFDIPQEGDLVIDTHNGSYGFVDMVQGNKAAVKEGWAVELAVPLTRLIKLVPTIMFQNLN